jgi:hypothetical protein
MVIYKTYRRREKDKKSAGKRMTFGKEQREREMFNKFLTLHR